MKQIEQKQTLSITIPIRLYQKLQREVGKGKISEFIKKTVEEKFQQEKNDLSKSYQECYANNPHLLELNKKWEKAQNEDWVNWKKEKSNGRKVN